ncbi:potassium transporter [Lentinula aciculospora]|uniref:Potassium transporter n=1 Tax=Lentinula aciculospora TaxID=153920 RepID=A0A9W9AGP9_9AGAR|nr:potassium transporter [Lentinula aciculospora]
MSIPSLLESGVSRKRTALKVHGAALASLSFQCLGIIYSDIGTSPLYVLNGIWPSSGPVPSQEDVIGGVSAIVWSLTLLPLIKYVLISLKFGTTEGEGGSFALYQGLYPPEDKEFDADRTLTGESYIKSTRSTSSRFKQALRGPLLVWCLLGTALTMADGVFTPAVSVTSAVGGIAVARSSVENQIVPISIAFLVVLFLVQQFGTGRLAFVFAPVSFIWFLLLIGTGIYNISTFPGIFRALDPSRAILLFVRTKDFDLLAGVLLAVTGCEAVFANLGQFNAASIRISFCCFVYPGLILAYLGQGARLIVDGENVIQNVFYMSIPGPKNGPLFWIMFAVAIFATYVASQALITATFSLFQQVVNMKSFPSLRMHYTSETIMGQVYIPAVNWTLMIITVIIVAVFSSLANLTNAYGFAVATVMFSTSLLLAVQMVYVKRWSIVVAVAYFLIFGFFDGLFWGAALKKVPHGAWVPLMIGLILMVFMVFWTWSKGLEDAFDGANRQNLRHFIWREDKIPLVKAENGQEIVEEVKQEEEVNEPIYYYVPTQSFSSKDEGLEIEKRELTRIPTMAVFHKFTLGRGVPHTFVGFIRQWPALPQILIFLSVSMLPIARAAPENRYVVVKTRSLEGCYGVTYNMGFREHFDVNVRFSLTFKWVESQGLQSQLDELVESLCNLEMQHDPKNYERTIAKIKAVSSHATHIVPHYHVVSKKINAGYLTFIANWIRKYLIEEIFRRLATMFPETANWMTSADEIIRVGINATI